MKNRYLLTILTLSIFLQSCYIFYGVVGVTTEYCHPKTWFGEAYHSLYKYDWANRKNFADTRQYFSNFNLFEQLGKPFTNADTANFTLIRSDDSKNTFSYLYKVSWQDSFYLYHYSSPYVKRGYVCAMYNARFTDSFRLERPIWKFYKLDDTTYFSIRFVGENYRDSVLHQPQQLYWKRIFHDCDTLGNCVQAYNKKGEPIFNTYQLARKDMPTDLFWQIVDQDNPKIQRKYLPNFSMDSLIRSFQK